MKTLKMLYLGAQKELCEQPQHKSYRKHCYRSFRNTSKTVETFLRKFWIIFDPILYFQSSVRTLSMPQLPGGAPGIRTSAYFGNVALGLLAKPSGSTPLFGDELNRVSSFIWVKK